MAGGGDILPKARRVFPLIEVRDQNSLQITNECRKVKRHGRLDQEELRREPARKVSPQPFSPYACDCATSLLRGLCAVAPVLQAEGIVNGFFYPTLRFECCLGGEIVNVRTGIDRKDIPLLFGFVDKGSVKKVWIPFRRCSGDT